MSCHFRLQEIREKERDKAIKNVKTFSSLCRVLHHLTWGSSTKGTIMSGGFSHPSSFIPPPISLLLASLCGWRSRAVAHWANGEVCKPYAKCMPSNPPDPCKGAAKNGLATFSQSWTTSMLRAINSLWFFVVPAGFLTSSRFLGECRPQSWLPFRRPASMIYSPGRSMPYNINCFDLFLAARPPPFAF